MDEHDDISVDAIARRLNANQPHPAELAVAALEQHRAGTVIEQAAAVLAAIQRHYELRPR